MEYTNEFTDAFLKLTDIDLKIQLLKTEKYQFIKEFLTNKTIPVFERFVLMSTFEHNHAYDLSTLESELKNDFVTLLVNSHIRLQNFEYIKFIDIFGLLLNNPNWYLLLEKEDSFIVYQNKTVKDFKQYLEDLIRVKYTYSHADYNRNLL